MTRVLFIINLCLHIYCNKLKLQFLSSFFCQLLFQIWLTIHNHWTNAAAQTTSATSTLRPSLRTYEQNRFSLFVLLVLLPSSTIVQCIIIIYILYTLCWIKPNDSNLMTLDLVGEGCFELLHRTLLNRHELMSTRGSRDSETETNEHFISRLIIRSLATKWTAQLMMLHTRHTNKTSLDPVSVVVHYSSWLDQLAVQVCGRKLVLAAWFDGSSSKRTWWKHLTCTQYWVECSWAV